MHELSMCASVQMLGLWGMGGIGKTTIAEWLFESLLSAFGDTACFLKDVRSVVSSADGLVKLQQKLLKALTGIRIDVEDTDTGPPS